MSLVHPATVQFKFREGDRVVVNGLRGAVHYNGTYGTIEEDFDVSAGRYHVTLDLDGSSKSLLANNLEKFIPEHALQGELVSS